MLTEHYLYLVRNIQQRYRYIPFPDTTIEFEGQTTSKWYYTFVCAYRNHMALDTTKELKARILTELEDA